MNESKKNKVNREFALSMIVEALHSKQISECDALDLAFEANGNHGEWTDERVDELERKINLRAEHRHNAIVARRKAVAVR